MRISQINLTRERLYSNVEQKIKKVISSIAEEVDCSRNMVTNTILADALGIPIEDHDRYDSELKFPGKLSAKARKRIGRR